MPLGVERWLRPFKGNSTVVKQGFVGGVSPRWPFLIGTRLLLLSMRWHVLATRYSTLCRAHASASHMAAANRFAMCFCPASHPPVRQQGDCIPLSCLTEPQHAHTFIVVPADQFAARTHAFFRMRGVELEHVEDKPSDNGQVLWRIVTTHRAGILAQHHIQTPMRVVLDGPVIAYGIGQRFGCEHL